MRQRKELVEKTEIILDMAVQVGSAMHYLEKNGFIHRDLVSVCVCVFMYVCVHSYMGMWVDVIS